VHDEIGLHPDLVGVASGRPRVVFFVAVLLRIRLLVVAVEDLEGKVSEEEMLACIPAYHCFPKNPCSQSYFVSLHPVHKVVDCYAG
jgi:hypothetical protein